MVEAARLRRSLQRIHFYDASKTADTQEAQRGVAAVVAAAALAQRISLMRSKVDGATMSIATHAMIAGKIRDAEEALVAGDAAGASDRLTEAQAKLTDASSDLTQAILRKSLAADLPRLIRERAGLPDTPKDQAVQPASTVASAAPQPAPQEVLPATPDAPVAPARPVGTGAATGAQAAGGPECTRQGSRRSALAQQQRRSGEAALPGGAGHRERLLRRRCLDRVC
jgi:hypothetical protein